MAGVAQVGYGPDWMQLSRGSINGTPGVDFGRNAEGYLRFCYANSLERIDEALTRIAAFLHRRASERPPR